MWKLLGQQVGNRKLRNLTLGFILAAFLQGLTFALLIPFLKQFFTGEVTPELIALIAALGIITFLVTAWVTIRSYKISVYDICGTFIERVAEQVLSLPLGWFDARRQALIAAAVSKEVNTLSHVASIVIPGLMNGLVVPLVMVLATFIVDWRLALLMVAAILPLYATWGLMRRRALASHRLETQAAIIAAGRLIEYAGLQPVLRANGVVEAGWQPLDQALSAESAATINAMTQKSRPIQQFSFLIQLTFALVLLVGLYLAQNQQLDILSFIAIATIAARVTVPLSQSIIYAAEAHNAEIALLSVKEIFDAQPLPEVQALPEGRALPEVQALPEDREISETRESSETRSDVTITFKDVSFGYLPNRPVLENISFTAPAGQITALVGASGCGKSTILRLAARFWDVQSGQVSLGGTDVRQLPLAELMQQTSMVFQDVFLFDTTIRENLLLARPDATEAQLLAAAQAARLDKVIESLPAGWETEVGQGGLKLSGGERQRVAIARAFLKDAPILLLDEITSALDGENEMAITGVIRELSRGRTVIVVAHRLTTIQNADQVVVLALDEQGSGRIIQQGTPAQLAQQPGAYADFVAQSQLSAAWNL